MGSCVGGGLRYLIGRWMTALLPNAAFPCATLTVNVVGCLLIGWLAGMLDVGDLSPTAKALLVTGFCGGFTTFSTFINENMMLWRDGQWLGAVAYTALSLLLGMAALAIGYALAK